jgi:hypothetical protein
VLKVAITKQFMVNELIAAQVQVSPLLQTVYVLLLLKLDEEQMAKHNSFVVIKNDNLLVWTEVLMETALMDSILGKNATQNTGLVKKVKDIVDTLAEHQELMKNAQFVLHNM